MESRGNRWALVLAAGSGTRLQRWTGGPEGRAVPKQYCSLSGGPSLLRETVARARGVVPMDRIVVVVADEHACWWRPALSDLPEQNVVVQPMNRGTAAGILLPLLTILDRDPGASVAVFPSDHFVADERRLAQSLRAAFDLAEEDQQRIVLLGIEPGAPDTEYGWIVPGEEGRGDSFDVRTFVEKPRPDIARELLGRGAVWNSFLMVASGPALRALFLRRRPSLLGALVPAPRGNWHDDESRRMLTRIYSNLPSFDFSRELLQGSEDWLAVLPVPDCGWSDLGTPDRVSACMRAMGPGPATPSPAYTRAPVSLAAALSAPFPRTSAPEDWTGVRRTDPVTRW